MWKNPSQMHNLLLAKLRNSNNLVTRGSLALYLGGKKQQRKKDFTTMISRHSSSSVKFLFTSSRSVQVTVLTLEMAWEIDLGYTMRQTKRGYFVFPRANSKKSVKISKLSIVLPFFFAFKHYTHFCNLLSILKTANDGVA